LGNTQPPVLPDKKIPPGQTGGIFFYHHQAVYQPLRKRKTVSGKKAPVCFYSPAWCYHNIGHHSLPLFLRNPILQNSYRFLFILCYQKKASPHYTGASERPKTVAGVLCPTKKGKSYALQNNHSFDRHNNPVLAGNRPVKRQW
jgi:hypothetical protein